jgi:hypothetical protein
MSSTSDMHEEIVNLAKAINVFEDKLHIACDQHGRVFIQKGHKDMNGTFMENDVALLVLFGILMAYDLSRADMFEHDVICAYEEWHRE